MNQRTLDILQLEAELWAVRIQMQFQDNMLGERKNYAKERAITTQGEERTPEGSAEGTAGTATEEAAAT